MTDRDDWFTTASGRKVHILSPDPEQIHVDDIAHALSHICRFGGHVRQFYSVAQHSVHVSHLVPLEHARIGLMHDATEAYLGDVIRPLKQVLGAKYAKWKEDELGHTPDPALITPWEPKIARVEFLGRWDELITLEARERFHRGS